jgi:seryl-tRNA synthetase
MLLCKKWVLFMHDIQFIRDHPDIFDAGLKKRNLAAQAVAILALDGKRRAAIAESQELQTKRNTLSKQIGELKRQGVNTDMIMAEVAGIKDKLADLENLAASLDNQLQQELAYIPNLPANDVPVGADEAGNVELRRVGQPPQFPFAPKAHYELGEALGLMDFTAAAKLSGARFTVLRGALARMERALGAFMLDIHTREFGYGEIAPPLMVNDAAMFGTGNLPKFATDSFYADSLVMDDAAPITDDKLQQQIFSRLRKDLADRNPELLNYITQSLGNDSMAGFAKLIEAVEAAMRQNQSFAKRKWLIPTAEVPLTNLVADSILDAASLPIRVTAFTPCFRSEAGSAGRDTRGMLRQHQFGKVELVSITTPEQSVAEHERMTQAAETVLQRLGLAYRVVALCTGDMGFPSRKTYDIEVWLPGQNTYREISSCSNCGDFQARRMSAKYRPSGEKNTHFVHTLNGSGVAVGRCLIAIMENYQNADGSITVPPALRPFMDGMEKISG